MAGTVASTEAALTVTLAGDPQAHCIERAATTRKGVEIFVHREMALFKIKSFRKIYPRL